MSSAAQTAAPTAALQVVNVSKYFGGLAAISDVSLEVPHGTVTALIGPNGAGKTTLFNLVTNLFPPSAGDIYFYGTSLNRLSPGRIARLGLIRTFQTARVFPGMTVLENVLIGGHRRLERHGFEQMLWLGSARREERALTGRADAFLELAGMSRLRDLAATDLPMGSQKLLEVIRALMARPRLLLLDEPAAGLNDAETAELGLLLRAVRDTGTTVMVVEHNMSLVMGVADRVMVLDAGCLVATGTPQEIRENSRVIEAYVGQSEGHGMMLELRGIAAGYGGLSVIHDIDLVVRAGEIVTLVGANGAGKSTLVKTISGLLRAHRGQILFDGRRIDTLSPRARVLLGIAHVPEGRQTFAGLTVAENLELGGLVQRHRAGADNARRMREVCQRFPVLRERLHEVVANFSGGQHQMLAIARGLMANPKLLILDEPSLGLAPVLVSQIFRLIAELRDEGVAILLSEQNARLSLAIAARGYVIEKGRVAVSGTGDELLHSTDIAERYLGVGTASGEANRPRDQEFTAKLRELMQS